MSGWKSEWASVVNPLNNIEKQPGAVAFYYVVACGDDEARLGFAVCTCLCVRVSWWCVCRGKHTIHVKTHTTLWPYGAYYLHGCRGSNIMHSYNQVKIHAAAFWNVGAYLLGCSGPVC